MDKSFVAHYGKNGEIQTVKQHCEETAELCRRYAIPELKDLLWCIGLLHDAGKYRESFQKRIHGDAKIRTEHSIVGAQMLGKTSDPMTLMAQLCIAGHHSGIPNCGTRSSTDEDSDLYGRLKRKTDDLNEEIVRKELEVPNFSKDQIQNFCNFLSVDCKTKEDVVEKFAFLARYSFSCLTDADTINTIKASGDDTERTLYSDFEACDALISAKLTSLTENSQTLLQQSRSMLQKQAFANIEKDSEIYLMNMPTGSGKTLTSMYCALKRALKMGITRIIYIIPYNSIIEQTADEFEKLFGSCAKTLRHQSTYSFEEYTGEDSDEKKNVAKYACENWDSSIIITTAVQFFESIYSNKRGKLRKLHNMSDSILVFDEAHLMPVDLLQPCLRAIAYITKYLNSEALFLTATMPDYELLIKKYALSSSRVTQLITDKSIFKNFKKCSFSYIGEQSDEAIVLKALEKPTSLVVVNSRSGAKNIFSNIPDCGLKYHLSTYMTAFDRSEVIREIKEKVKQLEKDYPGFVDVPPERRITVVSTSLIEAGVDLDFCCVMREISGLDNILQAGGRCNREGKRKDAEVLIFERCDSSMPKGDLGIRINVSKDIIKKYNDNLSSLEAIADYYNRLYNFYSDDISSKSISNECKDIFILPFADYSLRMIDTNTVSVAVERNDESKKLIEDLKQGFPNAKKLQKYCFSVYTYEFEKLLEQHTVDDYGSGIYCLTNPDYYDCKTGICFEGKDVYCD